MNENSKQCIVAGGGVIGIAAAILLADKYENVTLVEKGKDLGGLLYSCQDDLGNYYDYGTHIPTFTNIAELDNLLYGYKEEIEKNWVTMNPLRSQNYFKGQWNRKSCLIDAKVLDKKKYMQGIFELFQCGKFDPEGLNLAEYILKTFGPTFTEEIYRPIIKKLFAIEPERLEPQSSLSYFGLTRLIVLSPEISNLLKKIEFFDNKLGYHEAGGLITTPHLYPKSPKGSAYWIDSLVKKAKGKGVDFKTEASIDKINLAEKQIKSVEISGAGRLDCDLLVWTVPPFLAFKAAGLEYDFKPPKLRTTTIFHYCVDKELMIKDVPYVWCWDPAFNVFRITLYPNINPQKTEKGYTVTAEVLSSVDEAKGLTDDKILSELKDLGIVERTANVLSKTMQIYPNTFPAPEIGFTDNALKVAEQMQQLMTNTLLLGRSSGKVWFMIHALIQAYKEISALKADIEEVSQ